MMDLLNTPTFTDFVITEHNGHYGFSFTCNNEVYTYKDLTTDKEKINRFVEKLSHNDFSLTHINEIIEDFIS